MLLCVCSGIGQDFHTAENRISTYENAYELAYNGKTSEANRILNTLAKTEPDDYKTKSLLGSTASWTGNYELARLEFNKVLSKDKSNRNVWISAIKNELYAKNYALALGLCNKASINIKPSQEVERLKSLALSGIATQNYPDRGWYNVESEVSTNKKKKENKSKITAAKDFQSEAKTGLSRKVPFTPELQKNMVAVNNAVTIFDQRYDPMTYTSISLRRQTAIGSVIPRINYSNRLGKNGLQYDLDVYPKITKGLYAYLNYGFSNSEIYPKHKLGGDIYLNIKKGFEFSAGGRFINFATRDVKVLTNSVGYYKGNYYFSLRSYITPVPNGLTKGSGNLLVRKYLKDAENYIGINGGFGFSPELRQFTSGDLILAETLLYIESQRLSFEYQFTGKNNLHAYRTNLGIMRQELAYAPGTFFWSFSAGLTYEINF